MGQYLEVVGEGKLATFLGFWVSLVCESLPPSQFSLISSLVTTLFSYMCIEFVGHILCLLSREQLTVCTEVEARPS